MEMQLDGCSQSVVADNPKGVAAVTTDIPMSLRPKSKPRYALAFQPEQPDVGTEPLEAVTQALAKAQATRYTGGRKHVGDLAAPDCKKDGSSEPSPSSGRKYVKELNALRATLQWKSKS